MDIPLPESTDNDSDAKDSTTVYMPITEGDWVDLKEVMEVLGPLKEFSKKCESNSTCGISSVLRLSLVLLYHVVPTHVSHTGSRTSKQNRIVVTLRSAFTSFLDDAEQFFLWACAAALDGRQKDLQWAVVVWANDPNRPKVTSHWRDLHMLKKRCGGILKSKWHIIHIRGRKL